MKFETIITTPLMENCYIVYDEETKEGVVIDPGSKGEKITNKINELGINLKYIIFTHGHFDHIRGYFELKESFPNSKLLASEKETEVIYDPLKSFLKVSLETLKTLKVDTLLKDKDLIEFGNSSLRVIETPGHTKGSICLLSDKTLFSGDTLFKDGMGRCDLPTGSLKEEVNSIINILFKLPEDIIVYPGHGEFTTIEHEKNHNEVYSWL